MAVHNNPDSMEAFAGALGNFIRDIQNFSDFSDESIKYLLHKAQQLRDYLDS